MTGTLSLPRWRRSRLGRPMLRLWRVLVLGAELAAVASLLACADGPDPVDPSRLTVDIVEVRAPRTELAAGAQVSLSAIPRARGGTALPDRQVAWASTDTTILTVTSAGVVTGRRAGSANVTATSEGRSGSAQLRVTTNPAPIAAHLTPSSAIAGTGALQITVEGHGFVPEARVLWDGAERPTTFVSVGRLRAQLSAADLAQDGAVEVAVRNPTPGGGTSASLTFTVSRIPVALVQVQPSAASVLVGQSVQLRATVLDAGGRELEGRDVSWASSGHAAIVVDASGLVMGGVPGQDTITATSEGVSGTAVITVAYPVPAIDSLTPGAALEGSAELTLTVWGRNFGRESIVRWNGQERATTFVRGIELRATIHAYDLAAAGTGSVTVENPAPGGGSSSPTSFTITRAVHSVEVNGGPGDLWVGESTSFTAIPRGRDGEALARPVTWSSTDTTVARVDTMGAVITLKAGTALISAASEGVSGSTHVSAATPPQYDVLYEGWHAGWPELWIQSPGANAVPRRILPEGREGRDPAVSPDGSRIAFVGRSSDWNLDIWVVNRDGTGLRQLTSGASTEDQPAWSPDGTRIVYRSDAESGSDIWVVNADGTGPINLTRNQWRFGQSTSNSPAWGPDGRIAFSDVLGPPSYRAVIRSMNPDGTDWRTVADDPAWTFGDPAYSPDGRFLAVRMSGMNGQGSFVNVLGVNGEPLIWTSFPIAGTAPAWSPDSRWLAVSLLNGMGPCTCTLWLADLAGSVRRPISNGEGLSAGEHPAWIRRQ